MSNHECHFWVKEPKYLFTLVVNDKNPTLDEKLNILFLSVFIFLFVFYIIDYITFSHFIIFLLISITIIIIFHSILVKEEMSNKKVVENFSWTRNNFEWEMPKSNTTSSSYQKVAKTERKDIRDNSGYDTYVGLDEIIKPNQNYYSSNDALANGDNKYNPNIFIKPLMPPPLAEISQWRTNNAVNNSGINYRSRTDLVQSGYLIKNPCGCYPNTLPQVNYGQPTTCGIVENFEQRKKIPTIEGAEQEEKEILATEIDEKPEIDEKSSGDTERVNPNLIEVRTTPITGSYAGRGYTILDRPRFDTDINAPFGYYPNNPKLKNAPVNVPTRESDKFNKKIFTTAISPLVALETDVVQPVNGMLGITYPQQFQPKTYIVENNNKIIAKRNNPRTYRPEEKREIIKQNYSNVFDPTSQGAGTDYRGYIEPIVGQPRYYYDDIKNVRQPNMITRNKIDHAPWAEEYGLTYGTAPQRGVSLEEVKQMAHDQFNQSEMRRRTDLQSSLMRKRVDIDWQRRIAPIFTGSSSAVH